MSLSAPQSNFFSLIIQLYYLQLPSIKGWNESQAFESSEQLRWPNGSKARIRIKPIVAQALSSWQGNGIGVNVTLQEENFELGW